MILSAKRSLMRSPWQSISHAVPTDAQDAIVRGYGKMPGRK